jgi:hypothetical protein
MLDLFIHPETGAISEEKALFFPFFLFRRVRCVRRGEILWSYLEHNIVEVDAMVVYQTICLTGARNQP